MTGQLKLMTPQEIRALTTATLTDPAADLAVPVGLALTLREGLTVLAPLIRGDHHPAVGDTPRRLPTGTATRSA